MSRSEDSYWDLIAERLYNELGDQEDFAFDDWMQQEVNQSDRVKAEKIHEGLKSLKELAGIDKESSWKMIRRKIRYTVLKKYTTATLKYAAIILITLFIGHYFNLAKKQDSNVQYAEIEVLNGQMGHLFLFDGTEVWLNSGSRFKYPNQFNQNERNVFLQGEAFFKVTHNKDLPFVVQTDHMQVKVLGTSFNVLAYKGDNQQSVILEEGKVQINRQDGVKLTELSPGQRAILRNSSSDIKVDNVQTALYTEWKEGIVVFESEHLGEIAKKLERWYNVDIKFENEDLKAYQLTGTILRNKPIDQTIKAIELLAPIKYEYVTQTNKKDIINIRNK